MQAQAKPKPSTQFEPSQPRLKFPTKEIEPPPPSSDPKPSNQIKKPTKQPPSNPKPTDLKTTQKRKEPNSKSKPKSQPLPKRPTIKINTLNLHLSHHPNQRHHPTPKNLKLRFLIP